LQGKKLSLPSKQSFNRLKFNLIFFMIHHKLLVGNIKNSNEKTACWVGGRGKK